MVTARNAKLLNSLDPEPPIVMGFKVFVTLKQAASHAKANVITTLELVSTTHGIRAPSSVFK